MLLFLFNNALGVIKLTAQCTTVHCTWSILTDSLSEVFGRSKLDKKGSRNIYIFFFNQESYRDFD